MSKEVAIVTGAGSGIGRAIAQELSSRGLFVALLGRTKSKLDETLALLPHLDSGLVLTADLIDESDVSSAVERAAAHFGSISVLVNSAGAWEDELAADLTLERWNEIIGTNLTAPFLMSRAVLPHMVARGGGSIINIGSVASLGTGGGGVAYTSSKHGLLGLASQLAMQYGHRGIRVNTVCPGSIETDMTSQAGRNPNADAFIARLPIGRQGRTTEVAKVVAFLASEDAAYVTGASWTVGAAP
jgi:3-oxoacyl-[acyl-carrier protein] reductase